MFWLRLVLYVCIAHIAVCWCSSCFLQLTAGSHGVGAANVQSLIPQCGLPVGPALLNFWLSFFDLFA